MIITGKVAKSQLTNGKAIVELLTGSQSHQRIIIEFDLRDLPDPARWQSKVARIGTGLVTADDGYYSADGHWITEALPSDMLPPG